MGGRGTNLRITDIKITETTILREHQLAACKDPNTRLWRNNVGVFFTQDGRVIRTGLCPGSADLIGFDSVVVTPEMVGQRIAIFRADEVKREDGTVQENQKKWLDMCRNMGARVNIVKGKKT